MNRPFQRLFTREDVIVLKEELLYQGTFRLVRYTLQQRFYDGTLSEVYTREVLLRRSAVAVLPYDPYLDRVILIEQFRPGSLNDTNSPWLIEIPAGIFEANEKPEAVAHRETLEEAGCQVLALEHISDHYVSPGGTNEYLHIFCGKIESAGLGGIHGLKTEQEDIRTLNLSSNEAFAYFANGHVQTGPAIIALLWLQLNRERLMQLWQRGPSCAV